MADYDIQHDFSEQEGRGESVSGLNRTLAQGFGRKHLENSELKDLLTRDGKRLTARLTYRETPYGTKVQSVHIEPAEGSAITNIDAFMKALCRKQGMRIHATREPETVKFTRQYSYGEVEYCIRTRTSSPEDEAEQDATAAAPKEQAQHPLTEEIRIRSTMTPAEMMAAVADTDDSLDEMVSERAAEPATRPAAKEEKAEPTPTPVPKTLEDIAGYCVVGERKEGEFYGRHNHQLALEIVDSLQSTIRKLEMTTGVNPLLAYTAEDGVAITVDIFPPRGAAITGVELRKDAMLLKEQRKDTIRYAHGATEFVVHRRHPDESYDIRGEMSPQGAFSGQVPPPAEVEEKRQLLRRLPIIIRASDGTEANVVYQHPFANEGKVFPTTGTALRVMLTPKAGASLYIVGLEQAKAEGSARERHRSSRLKDIEIKMAGMETNMAVVVFTTMSQSVEDWENKGGAAKKDFFERFYEQHQAIQR